LEWERDQDTNIDVEIAVGAFGLQTRLEVEGYRPAVATYPEDWGAFPDGFSVQPVGEPGEVGPGEEAHLSFATTMEGVPYANGTVGVVAIQEEFSKGPAAVEHVRTDESGLLNLTYRLPDDWVQGRDYLVVYLYSPENYQSYYIFPLANHSPSDPWIPADPSLDVSVLEDAANGTLRVSANYTGGQNLSGWRASFEIRTLMDPSWKRNVDGQFPFADLNVSGTQMEGEVAFPGWLWEGDYVVTVHASPLGRTLGADPLTYVHNTVIVHLRGGNEPHVVAEHPQEADPPATTPPATEEPDDLSGTSSPPVQTGDPSYIWLIILAALVVAVTNRVLGARRRGGEL